MSNAADLVFPIVLKFVDQSDGIDSRIDALIARAEAECPALVADLKALKEFNNPLSQTAPELVAQVRARVAQLAGGK